MPWWGRWELSCCSNSRRVWSRWRWFQTRVQSSSSRRQVCTQRSMSAFIRGIRIPLSTTSIPASVKDGVEQGGVLPVAVADHEPGPAAGVLEIHDEVPGGLCHPGSGRVRRRARDADAPAGVPDHREHVQPRPGQGDRFEEVTCQQGISPGAQKVRPGAGTPLGYWVDPRPFQDLPRRGGGHPHAQNQQLTVDAPVAKPGFSRARRSTRTRIERTVRGRPARLGRERAAWR